MNKGLLWRLKDTAHHLLRDEAETGPHRPAPGLVRGLHLPRGHEDQGGRLPAADLRPAATGSSWTARSVEGERHHLPGPLPGPVADQRIHPPGGQAGALLLRPVPQAVRGLPLGPQAANALLARFLFEHEPLVRKIFGQDYELLLASIYGPSPHMLYVMASQSLRQGGWLRHAAQAAAEKACAHWRPTDPAASCGKGKSLIPGGMTASRPETRFATPHPRDRPDTVVPGSTPRRPPRA